MYKKNRQIPIAKKLEIIEYSKIHGKNKAAQYAGVSTKCIRNWIKNEYYYENFLRGNMILNCLYCIIFIF